MMTGMDHEWAWRGFLDRFAASAEKQGFSSEMLMQLDAGPLMVWERAGDGPAVHVSSGIHGDEPAGPLALLRLMEEGFFPEDVHWRICPALNPGGLAVSSRENAAGHDLNRDYWKLTNPETIAHVRWLESFRSPDLFISLHEDWETRGFYFYEINLGKDHPERAAAVIESVTPWFPPEPGPLIDGHEAREDGWIYHAAEADVPEGWPEAIYLAHHGCPLSFTFETPSQAALTDRVAAHVAGVRAIVEQFSLSQD